MTKNRMFTIKRKAGICGVFAVMMSMLIAFSGCGTQNNGSASSNQESIESTASKQENQESFGTVKIGVLKTADSFPLYVANEKGFYKENNLDVELVEFGSASEQSTAMEAGEIDVMMTDMIVECLIKKGGQDVRTVRTSLGSDVTQGKFLVVSSPKSDMKKPEDLKTAKIGISEGTMMEFLIDSYFKELGVSEDQVTKVNLPNISLRYDLLMSGDDIDCAVLPDPLGDYAVSNGAVSVIDDTKLSNNYSITVIIASKKFMENQDALDKFLKSYDEAVDAINKNPSDFKELILEKTSVPPDMKDTYEVGTYAYKQVPTEEEVKRVIDWMQEKELLSEPFTYEEVVEPIK